MNTNLNGIEIALSNLTINEKDLWVVTFRGKRLKFSSGKSVWTSSGAARNSFANQFRYTARDFGFKTGSEFRKALEEKGIIEIKQISDE